MLYTIDIYECMYVLIEKQVMFVENKRLKASLVEEIDESQLREIYGGRLQLVPIQDA